MGKKLLCALFAVTLVIGIATPAYAASVTDFTDVQSSDWFYGAVDYVAENGLFEGTSATTFSPYTTMTRGMFVTVLGRHAGVPENYGSDKSAPFTDVKQKDYFFTYATWASDNSIVEGIGGGLFDPQGLITREQVATIIFRYALKFGYDDTYSLDNYLIYTDIDSVSGYAKTAMIWATTHGIVSGEDGKLDPQGKAIRAMVAQSLLDFSKLGTGEPGKPEEPENPDWENYNPTYDVPTGKSAVDADGGYYDYDLANELMKQVNDLRIENGVDALKFHPLIQEWASIRAYEASVSFSHTRPDGTAFNTVGQGVVSTENLLRGDDYTASWKSDISGYARDVITAWYNSTGHRHAMLSYAPNLGAISCYVNGNNVYIAHLFSQRSMYAVDFMR